MDGKIALRCGHVGPPRRCPKAAGELRPAPSPAGPQIARLMLRGALPRPDRPSPRAPRRLLPCRTPPRSGLVHGWRLTVPPPTPGPTSPRLHGSDNRQPFPRVPRPHPDQVTRPAIDERPNTAERPEIETQRPENRAKNRGKKFSYEPPNRPRSIKTKSFSGRADRLGGNPAATRPRDARLHPRVAKARTRGQI